MTKILKLLSLLLASSVAFIAIVFIAVICLINPNDYKQTINQQVSAKLQHDFKIQGNLSWTFFPWLGLNAQDITLSNAPGFTGDDLATIKRMTLNIKLLPLLYKHLEINTLDLDGLNLNLQKNVAGQSNWQAMAQSAASSDATDKDARKNSPLQLKVSTVNIQNARIIWADTKQQHILDDVTLRMSNIAVDKFFPLSLTANYATTKASKKIPLSIKANVQFQYPEMAFSLTALQVQLANMQLNGEIFANKQASELTGKIHIPSFNFRQLMHALEKAMPAMQNNETLQKVEAEFNFKKNEQALKVDNIKLQIDNSHLAGNMLIQQQTMTTQLTLNNINFADYLAPSADNQPQRIGLTDASFSGKIAIQETSSGTLMQRLMLNGLLKMDALQIQKLHLTKFQTAINSQQGVLKFNAILAQLYQGKCTGSVTINTANARPSFNVEQQLAGIDIAALLLDFKELIPVQLSGKANLTVQLTSTGDDAAHLWRNLAGKAEFSVNQGSLQGINLDYWLQVGSALFHHQPIPDTHASNETQFKNLSGLFIIKQGIARNDNFLLRSDLLQVTGQGEVNLVGKELDYLFNAMKIDPTNNQPRKDIIPIRVKGPFAAISIKPDVEQLLRNQAKKELQKQAEGLQQKVSEQLGKKVGEQLRNLNLDKLFNR